MRKHDVRQQRKGQVEEGEGLPGASNKDDGRGKDEDEDEAGG